MDGPFIYDKCVTGKNFIGRKTECTILGNFITQGENAVIILPPRGGKTSLIQQTLFNLRVGGLQYLTGQFSVQNIRSSVKFLQRFGGAVIRMVASTPGEYADIISRYLGGTHFIFDWEEFSQTDEVIAFNWDVDEADMLAMFRLPYLLAAEKQTRMILVIDEFQSLAIPFHRSSKDMYSFSSVMHLYAGRIIRRPSKFSSSLRWAHQPTMRAMANSGV